MFGTIDWRPVIIYIIAIHSVAFLVGFSTTFLTIFIIYKRRRREISPFKSTRFYTLTLPLSFLVGLAFLITLILWLSQQKEKSRLRSLEIKESIVDKYALVDFGKSLDKHNILKVTFKVPEDSKYCISLYGFTNDESVDQYPIRLDETVAEEKICENFEKGEHTITFRLKQQELLSSLRSIDFIYVIKPFPPIITEYTRIDAGIPFKETISEGINYYSPNIPGCVSFYNVPCKTNNKLHLNLTSK